MNKTCTKCNQEKELTCFNKTKQLKSGYEQRCRECRAAYYQANKAKALEYQRDYYVANRVEILAKQAIWYEENYSAALEYQQKVRDNKKRDK